MLHVQSQLKQKVFDMDKTHNNKNNIYTHISSIKTTEDLIQSPPHTVILSPPQHALRTQNRILSSSASSAICSDETACAAMRSAEKPAGPHPASSYTGCSCTFF